MAVVIRLKQSKFKQTAQKGKWYASAVSTGEVHTDELSRRIERNTTFTRGEVQGLIAELVDEMSAQMACGKTVVLDGFGRFRLDVTSDMVEKPTDFDIATHIRSLKCRFISAGKRDGCTRRLTKFFGNDVDVIWA